MPINNHAHDWNPEPYEWEFHKQLYVYQACEWVEITDSQTSRQLDETFYEERAACDAKRVHTFVPESVEEFERLEVVANREQVVVEVLDMVDLNSVATGDQITVRIDEEDGEGHEIKFTHTGATVRGE